MKSVVRVHSRRMSPTHNATACATHTAAPTQPGASGSLTAEEIRAPEAVEKFFGSTAPEFVRVPDCERLWGMKRGLTYALIKEGAIKSVCLRKPGAKTGVRLVHFQSVRDYLKKQLA